MNTSTHGRLACYIEARSGIMRVLCREQCSRNILDMLNVWSQLYIGVSGLPRGSQLDNQHKHWLEQGADSHNLHCHWMYGLTLPGTYTSHACE